MKNNEIYDLVKDVNYDQFDKFMMNKSSSTKVFEDLHSIEFDFSWLDKLEEVLPYLDTIVRKPRKFIMQEEEIVPIEKAKKISLETIRHLAQHTNLIQDVDEDGTITPSSVLNVHKEESYDIYENRFIYSLLINIKNFIQMRKVIMGAGEIYNLKRKINFTGLAKMDNDIVKVNLELDTISNRVGHGKNDNGEDEHTRLAKIELIINDYFNSVFVRELKGAVMVKSPIRKTNVILKDQNFKKVLELWEFIEKYDVKNKKEVQHNKYLEDVTDVENNLGITFFLNYFVSSMLSEPTIIQENTEVNKYYVKKLVSYFLDSNFGIDQKKFKKIVDDQFKDIMKTNAKEEKEIVLIMQDFVDEYNSAHKEVLTLLKK